MMTTERGPRTLFDKIWDDHVVDTDAGGDALLYIDRHLIHEGSRNGFAILAQRDVPVFRPDRTFGTADHFVSTIGDEAKVDDVKREILETFRRNVAAAGISAIDPADPQRGIVHVIGPELGLSRPGMTIVCGDSHSATHGALGAIAFGIGTSEVAHVLATQTLWQRRPRQMAIIVDGVLADDVSAKDLILAIIARIGADGGTGHAIEYSGSTIRGLSIEGRLTVCNMTIEAGARFGIIAPDEVTLRYLRDTPTMRDDPARADLEAYWRTLHSDVGAVFDRVIHVDAAAIRPMISWGTSPDHAIAVDQPIPDPDDAPTPAQARSWREARAYMGIGKGDRVQDLRFDRVFIGSCTNGRIEDLREAARWLRSARVRVPTIVVPGSGQVARQARAEGLDAVFRAAGCEWRLPGCSYCVGMNGDIFASGERCASTSNRNFIGRQGPGVRTHLVSPATAARIAVTGVARS